MLTVYIMDDVHGTTENPYMITLYGEKIIENEENDEEQIDKEWKEIFEKYN